MLAMNVTPTAQRSTATATSQAIIRTPKSRLIQKAANIAAAVTPTWHQNKTPTA